MRRERAARHRPRDDPRQIQHARPRQRPLGAAAPNRLGRRIADAPRSRRAADSQSRAPARGPPTRAACGSALRTGPRRRATGRVPRRPNREWRWRPLRGRSRSRSRESSARRRGDAGSSCATESSTRHASRRSRSPDCAAPAAGRRSRANSVRCETTPARAGRRPRRVAAPRAQPEAFGGGKTRRGDRGRRQRADTIDRRQRRIVTVDGNSIERGAIACGSGPEMLESESGCHDRTGVVPKGNGIESRIRSCSHQS